MTTYTVDVTETDIANGHPRAGFHCPLALAIARATDCDIVVVGLNHYTLPGKSIGVQSLPDEAGTFRYRFDEGLPVEPFSFTLELAEY